MQPSSPVTGYTQVATSLGPAQWNQETGALLVSVNDLEVTVSAVNIDTSALIAGIGGTGAANKTLADVVTSLADVAAIGATTDAPLSGSVTKEGATARTGISLWKRAVNVLIDLLAKLPAFGIAGTESVDVISVQGIASGTALTVEAGVPALGQALAAASLPVVLTAAQLSTLTPAADLARNAGASGSTTARVVLASDSPGTPAFTAIGTTADAPTADSTTKESATVMTGVSLWKRTVNVLIDVLSCLATVNQSVVRASSGVTALATTSNSAVQVLAANAGANYYHVRITNEGAVGGFYSIDGGTTWGRLSANTVIKNDGVKISNAAVQVKRATDGSDLSGIYGEAW